MFISLTKSQRDLLIEHIDKREGVQVDVSDANRMQALRVLLDARFVYGDSQNRPKRTFTTALGREMICQILGSVADAIVGQRVVRIRETREGWVAITRPDTQHPNDPRIERIHRDRAAYMRRYREKNPRPSRSKKRPGGATTGPVLQGGALGGARHNTEPESFSSQATKGD